MLLPVELSVLVHIPNVPNPSSHTLSMYSILLPECDSTMHSTQMSGLTCVFRRYDMSSNSPSGGMKEMVRSLSKRDNRTHWWNLTSSISTALPRVFLPVASNMTLSFNPNRNSGIPDR